MAITLLLVALPFVQSQPWMNTEEPPEVRAKKLVAAMTLQEKLSLFHGSCGDESTGDYTGNVCSIDRLGIPKQKNNDGPQGFRGKAGTSTQFPSGMTVAASWDPELMQSYGEAMGKEFYDHGANIQLGPGVNVARVPLNGRNFEYVSGEDPILGYHMAKALVTGIQSQGVVANVKHYVNNNQETDRGDQTASVDERTLFEIYYPPFEGAISANVGSAMCSYNRICKDCPPWQQGNWSCENSDTLKRDFKERLGFKGWVMSDWGATHSASMNAGLDQEMPGADSMKDHLADKVKSGEVSMDTVDDAAYRNLWPLFMVGAFDKINNNTRDSNSTSLEHNMLTRKLSAESTVLLKNNGLLPLDKTRLKSVAVIGEAMHATTGGGGSGTVIPYYIAQPLDAIRRHMMPDGPISNCSDGYFQQGINYDNDHNQSRFDGLANVTECCKMCASTSTCNAFTFTSDKACYMKSDAANPHDDPNVVSGVCAKKPCADGTCVSFNDGQDVAAAAKLAASADVAIIFVGTTSAEGHDRENLSYGLQDQLVSAVAQAAGSKAVVVGVAPGAVLTPWRHDVAAVLTPFLPGQEYGNAIADILFGVVNPSAKLPMTFPTQENETEMKPAAYPGVNGISVYAEKLLVGYRWYDSNGVESAYPFGHGLSYTNFSYRNLQISGRNVKLSVQNAGKVDGSEVVQLYLKFPDFVEEPPRQLKAFKKLHIAPGATADVEFNLEDRSFSVWDASFHMWRVVEGSFSVMLGSSSRDIRLTGQIDIGFHEEVLI